MAVAQIKKYQSLNETVRKFLQLLKTMKEHGELMLPPERVLCEKLYCSRKTLRRVLDIQEAKGVIIKKGRARSLSIEVVAPKPVGNFAFIANGQGMVANPAWNKLWTALSQMAETENISTKLVLTPYPASKEDYQKCLQDLPEILIMTTVQNNFVKNIIHDMPGKTIITTEEHYRGLFRNIVAMDNYAAGFLCAKKLAEHGYKRPAFICDRLIKQKNKPYVPYERRGNGFWDGCRKFGLEINKKSEFLISGGAGGNYELIVKIIEAAQEIVKSGFDSLFLHTDNDIGFVYEVLIKECRIPEDFGLVTVNSFDNAIMHNPPISASSHGTKEVAAMLIKQIKRIIETGEKNIGEIMVKPKFHEGATLK
jgi:DNA-binding LacI/PurR family transcriptional regulator